ncbi:glycoside hydrolase family 28 protein [Mucilaginibacter arboris]|uniref:Glycoside hydrolase family 28 protein n=1 Tax=Mucilaginibacter arboris TaxID=2682090 RepID=A0A7K1SRX7_9SPHI|nr:glycoside hydrolase family 28 protein [Mucilaginibacter arboris]MVN20078.1 glycoside hydrolase family 28 protein [Mucilaginibacter arboris]
MKRSILLLSIVFMCFSKEVFSQSYSWNKLPQIQKTSFKTDTFNILKYGAKADGITLNTKSINDAITACSNKGGGVVLVPGGMWITGPVEMKSNVNLHINRDAVLQFTDDFKQYKLVEGNWEGRPAVRNQSPISGTNLTNIAITGTGIIDGNGDAWRMVKKDKLTETQWKNKVASGGLLSDDKKTWYPSEQSLKGSKIENAGVLLPGKTAADYADIKDFLRPNLLVLTNCKRVLLEGVTFQNSPAWCLHPLLCEDLTVRNVYAKNPWYAQNGDGIDVESCKNVLLEGSTFDVGDDGICIKSGRDADGRKRGKPTENMIVKNCIVYHAHGGFVIGSEMSGGARNLFVSNCSFIGTDVGLRFKTNRGRGGIVEKIFVKDIAMKDIGGEAILFDMYYMAKDPVPLAGENREAPKVVLLPVTEETPIFRDFHISNIVCNGASKAVFIRGLPEMKISDIYMDNMVLTAKKGIDLQEAKNINFKNVRVIVADTNPVVNIQNSSLISLDNLQYNSNADLLFNVNGQSSGIKVTNTDASKAKTKTAFSAGADSKALVMK